MRYSLPGFLLILAGLGLGLVGLTQTVNSSAVAITKPIVTLPPPPAWSGPVVLEVREAAMKREHEGHEEAKELLPGAIMSLDASAADLENHPAASPLPLRDTRRSRVTAPSSPLLGWPISGDITQGFGCSPYYTGLTGPGCAAAAPWFHDGLDIGAADGTPVRAALTGTVRFAGPDGSGPLCNGGYRGYGLAVVIDNGAGWQALYGHLSQIAVVAGQNVTPDTLIGHVADTGCVSGPHLHFALRYEGELINPEEMANE